MEEPSIPTEDTEEGTNPGKNAEKDVQYTTETTDCASNLVLGGDVDNGVCLGSRRPKQQLLPSTTDQRLLLPPQLLQLTIHKDSNGYGMKVSGDNPVFVESVKFGGAAQRAGLIAGDMILKVNDTPVRYSKHTHVVQLIKSNVLVELTVQRAQKMQRPISTGVGTGTPLPQRDRITGPQPVDNAKRREMEFSKIKTLKLMLDQEKKNLENLKSINSPNSRHERTKAEANIRKLQEQLRQVGGEALGQTPQHVGHLNKHRRVVSSPEHMVRKHERQLDRHNKTSSGSWELFEKENEITPPGTPPPPYLSTNIITPHSDEQMEDLDGKRVQSCVIPPGNPTMSIIPSQIIAAQSNIIQKEIISMEDEEISDQECVVDEHGPFNYLQRLLEHENVAHLAVFLNYVLSNSDPAPLLFYLITGLYKEGSVKDMQKWAYEIHSTFLVPCAPLLWFSVDESLAREVDNVLQNEYNKVEILRKVFWKSRKKAKEQIFEQLRDFQQKRTAGLGTMYGPSDQQLAEAKGDKAKEQRIFEETLLPKLQQLVDEVEKEAPIDCTKNLALCSALSTVLCRIFVTRPIPGSPIDRVHHFVSREKSFKSRLMGKSRKMLVRGHPLVLQQYHEVTHCNHCQTIIWGVSPQGYQCTDCKLNIHRSCSKILEENCPGPVPQKRKELIADNKISKFMGKIRPAHHFNQNERQRRIDDDVGVDDFGHDRPNVASVVRYPSDRRPDSNTFNNSGTTQNMNELGTSESLEADTNALDSAGHESKKGDRPKSKSAPVSVNRSESYKERLSHKRNRNRRKSSDPSLSKTNDEQSECGLTTANFARSSSSSLSSSSLESASTSLEQVSGPTASATYNANIASTAAPKHWIESDDETDLTSVCWSSNISAEVLVVLSDAEKERQQVINELYETERNHVRTLKLLEGMFMRPLQESGVLPQENLQLLFPSSLISLKELHGAFEQKLRQRRIDHGYLVRSIGDLLLSLFEGQTGDELKTNAAQFCARQQIALEALKERRRKDENLHKFLTKAESHKACRRLQLKDLLPTVLQRITKYPLLFEKLEKITKCINSNDEIEIESLHRAFDSAKRILIYVNQAVKNAEDAHKLLNIQRKLDKSLFDKDSGNEFRTFDLTQHKLVHDGPLTMKKIPGIQLHGLLFENMMVLLQRQDDKYFIKYFPNLSTGGNESRGISPITSFDQQTLVRQSAVDKNTFFLIITKTSQMLELTAPSSNECKIWFKHISDAAEQYKPRSKSNQDILEDPATALLSHSNTRDSLENTSEKIILHTERNINAPNEDTVGNIIPESGSDSESFSLKTVPCGKTNSGYSLNQKNSKNAESINRQISNINDIETNESNKSRNVTDTNTNRTECGVIDGSNVRRDIAYFHSSQNARTLMQQCPLLEPSDIQVSISPALTAEPIITPSERLRRLDETIKENLAEKQRIVCDMFRVPNEHFTAIVDIAGQPEAQNDPSEIILAAYAQAQSLTEILSEYIRVNSEQEISAVCTAVCDQCHYRSLRAFSPLSTSKKPFNTIRNCSIQSSSMSLSSNDLLLQEDDGYCEIDAVRLPSIRPSLSTITSGQKPPSPSMITSTPELAKKKIASSMSGAVGDSQQASTKASDLATECKISENASICRMRNSKFMESKDKHDDSKTQMSLPALDSSTLSDEFISHSNDQIFTGADSCGPNRISHVRSLEPAIPCHIVGGIITALNEQISFLLPKINEKDCERERLRKENQHLRELLNSMHERQLVQDENVGENPGIGNLENTGSGFVHLTAQEEALNAVLEES